MNFKIRLLALLLLVMMVFTSCSLDSFMQMIPGLGGKTTTTTTTTTTTLPIKSTTSSNTNKPTPPRDERLDYSVSIDELTARYTLTQEEVDATIGLIDQIVELAKLEEADMDQLEKIFDEFDAAFYHIAQQMTISMIVYYYDMSDETASQRYLDTQDMFYALQDEYNEACRTMYLESPHKEELFEGWTKEEIQSILEYDPTIVAVKKEIDALEVQYNDLDDTSSTYDDDVAAIYAQIVTKNNELAKLCGFDNYYEYASQNVYGRDYDKETLADFKQYVIEYILDEFDDAFDRYEQISGLSIQDYTQVYNFMEKDFNKLKDNYLLMYLDSLDGTMGEGMKDVFKSKNCIFSDKINSHPTAFQTYLYKDEMPFCLFGNSGQSSTTVVHEIGHYYAAYANNDLSNCDLLETHSQGNEFLFLNYCSNKFSLEVYDVIEGYQLVNAYWTIIYATIIDEYEQKVYSLDSVEGFTSADFDAIMTEVCEAYGGVKQVEKVYTTDPMYYWRAVCVTNPVYYISYAVSSVAALEIAALAQEDTEAAYTAYTTLVEGVTYEDGFVKALEKAGLTSPFEEETYTETLASLFAK